MYFHRLGRGFQRRTAWELQGGCPHIGRPRQQRSGTGLEATRPTSLAAHDGVHGLANQTWGFLFPPVRLSVPRLGLSLGHPPSRPAPLPRDQILQVRGSPTCPVSFILSAPAPPAMLSSPGSRDEGEIRYQICPPSSHHDSEWLFLWSRTDIKQYHRATETLTGREPHKVSGRSLAESPV